MGGHLKIEGNFSSQKRIVGSTDASSLINTNGFDVSFAKGEGMIRKTGDGSLRIEDAGSARYYARAGTLILESAADATLLMSGGTSVVSGRLSSLSLSSLSQGVVLDIGGAATDTLTVSRPVTFPSVPLNSRDTVRFRFDLGAEEGDLLVLESGFFLPFGPDNPIPHILIDINNLGGLTTGIGYELIRLGRRPSGLNGLPLFSLAPELIADGWDATFSVAFSGYSDLYPPLPNYSLYIHLNAIPEGSTVIFIIMGTIVFVAAGALRKNGSKKEERIYQR